MTPSRPSPTTPYRPWAATQTLDLILDENAAPVARTRLFSRGVNLNNRLQRDEAAAGDRGCLACGNCVDACPVVREKRRFVFLQNHRTSLALENIVGPECRRCHACVQACPQVAKPVKEYAAAFRRVERLVHGLLIALMIVAAPTGVVLFHVGGLLPAWERWGLKLVHLAAGLGLLALPLVYFLADRAHFRRAWARVFRFGPQDAAWFKALWAHLRRPAESPRPEWGEFGPYSKAWFTYLALALPLLALTGPVKLLGSGTPAALAGWLHAGLAMLTDALILVHIYVKYLGDLVLNLRDLRRSLRKRSDLNYPLLYDLDRRL